MLTRRERGAQRALMQSMAQAQVTAAATAEKVEEAVSGDLIASSPALAERFDSILRRLDDANIP